MGLPGDQASRRSASPRDQIFASIEERAWPVRASPAPAVSAWMPATRAGMTEGLPGDQRLPAIRSSRRSRKEHGRSALLPAPAVSAWMPATRAGMTEGLPGDQRLHRDQIFAAIEERAWPVRASPAPAVSAWMPASRAGMTEGSSRRSAPPGDQRRMSVPAPWSVRSSSSTACGTLPSRMTTASTPCSSA